jgi:uncharacterized protein (TIGR02996 family)
VSEREQLLAAILARPDDDVRRLGYADWLEEYGESDRDRATVEFVRLSCTMRGSVQMPPAAYAWLESNWKRLVPSVVALSGAYVHRRDGRVIYFRPYLPYPLSRSKTGQRPCPMLLDFHRGLLRKVAMWSGYAAGATFDAFLADQPQALFDCAGLDLDGKRTYGQLAAGPPEVLARVKEMCRHIGGKVQEDRDYFRTRGA